MVCMSYREAVFSYLKQAAMTKINTGARFGIAEEIAGDVILMPSIMRTWNATLKQKKYWYENAMQNSTDERIQILETKWWKK